MLDCFAIAGLGFGVVAAGADCAGFRAAELCDAVGAAAPSLGTDACAFATGFFGATDLPALAVFLVLVRATLLVAALGAGFLGDNSKAGFGRAQSGEPTRVTREAGFTPAAAAARAEALDNAASLGRPSRSGLTMTWLS